MIRHLRREDLHRVPWKNGRGTTLEIASDAVDGGEWSWRCSIADVSESGPFSRFEGCERLIVCVEGNGMRLRIDGAPPIDVPRVGAALRFSGDAATVGELIDGPVRDANLMVRRDRWRAELELVEGAVGRELALAGVTIVVALQGSAVMNDAATSVALGTGDAAILSGADRVSLSIGGRAIIGSVRPVP